MYKKRGKWLLGFASALLMLGSAAKAQELSDGLVA
jgi:hypothetical protein